MNQIHLFVFAVIMAASLLGATHFSEQLQNFNSKNVAMNCGSKPKVKKAPMILGSSEVVFLGNAKSLVYDAKIDSGARTSSMHALNVKTFSKTIVDNSEKKELMFVSFDTEDDAGRKQQLEKMVSRVHQVRSASGITTRYFFKEQVWVNDRSYEIEVNLADRSHMSKKMILGKNLINQGYLIDTNKSYVMTQSLASIDGSHFIGFD